MRLRRLNLTRYGHFTDFTLDFGDRSTNGPDFHIIVGDNEAGKSTAFNGYLDLLFGIEMQSKYNFRHEYNALRIGALLEIDNKTIELTRIKRREKNLLGANDLPIDEEILTSPLQGLSREAYQMMFSLNDKILEQGGEEILASKGNLGRLLFEGASGSANLSKRLELLQERANNDYAERSRKGEIFSLKQELEEINKKKRSLDTQANTYKRLRETHQKANEAYQCARKAQDAILDEHSNLNVIKNAFPIWDDLMELEKRLAKVKHLPDVPNQWIDEVSELQKKLATAKEKIDDATPEIEQSNIQLKNLPEDPIIELQNEFAIVATMAVRDQSAREHLSKTHDQLSKIDTELTEIQQRLGANETTELADLVVPDDTIAELETLSVNETQLMQRLKIAQQEVSDAQETLKQEQELDKKATPTNKNEKVLGALLDRYSEKDAQQRLDLAEKTLSQINRKIERELKKLTPWTGNSDDIRSQDFPTPTQANRWRDRSSNLKKEIASERIRQADHAERRALNVISVEALLEQVSAITDTNAANTRRARDNAWTTHKARLDDRTADSFEKALADDDLICDKRFKATDHLSKLHLAKEELAKTDSILEVIANKINQIDSDLQNLGDDLKPVLVKSGLPENFQVEDLPEWLDNVRHLQELIVEEDEFRAERDQAKKDCAQRHSKLVAALTAVGEKPSEILDLKELLTASKYYLGDAAKREATHTAAKKAILQAETQMKQRKKELKTAKYEFEEWQTKWDYALKEFWLKEKNVVQIRALLTPLRKLTSLLAHKREIIETINTNEKICHEFREGVCKLIRSLELEEQSDVALQFSLLQKRLTDAAITETERNDATKARKAAELRLDKAEKDLSHIEKRAKEITAHFPTTEKITTLDDLSLILDQAKQKAELINDVSEKERHLIQHLGVKRRADAEMRLEADTLPAINARLTKIDEDLEQSKQEFERRIEERRDALQAINKIGGDASVALLEEKYRSILLEITNKADRSFALHLGVKTAERALSIYRDRHRSELLTQTGDAFKAITNGEFSHLATQPSQLGDQLIAVRSNGGSIAADEMSKGTRFQLYLALRLASYRRFCNKMSPLPFIGDDIMETFDDHRAKSTIRQFSEIAKDGQVLYFTHHRHLCKIAKDICGDSVMIHEIPKQSLR